VRVTFDVVGNGDPAIGFNGSDTSLNDADAEVVEPDYETSAVEQVTVTTPTPTATPTPTESPTVSGDDTTESPTATDATGATVTETTAVTTTGGSGEQVATATETPEGDAGCCRTSSSSVSARLSASWCSSGGVLLGRRL